MRRRLESKRVLARGQDLTGGGMGERLGSVCGREARIYAIAQHSLNAIAVAKFYVVFQSSYRVLQLLVHNAKLMTFVISMVNIVSSFCGCVSVGLFVFRCQQSACGIFSAY